MRCDIVSLGRFFPTFRRKLLLSSCTIVVCFQCLKMKAFRVRVFGDPEWCMMRIAEFLTSLVVTLIPLTWKIR